MNDEIAVYDDIPGGPELLAWFGAFEFFTMRKIVSLSLLRRVPSTLSLHGWITTDKRTPAATSFSSSRRL